MSQAACINDEITSRFAWPDHVEVSEDTAGERIVGVIVERLDSYTGDPDVSVRMSLRDAEALCVWLKEQPADLTLDAFLNRAQGQI